MFHTNVKSDKKNNLTQFAENESGSFGIIFGLSLTVLMMSAGLAIDYSRLAQAKGVMNDALDSAVLSVGHELSEGNTDETELRAVFDDFLAANLELRGAKPNNINVDIFELDVSSGKVKADVSGDVDMSIWSIAGYEQVKVNSSSEAIFSTNPVEIAMMLDVTGSMNTDDKIGSLKLAAVDAVNTLIPNGAGNNRVRIGLVPYSWSVNAGDFAKTVKGESNATYTGKCVTERGIETHKDTSYEVFPLEGHERVTNDDYCPTNEIQPLTGNRTKLIDEIQSFNAAGWTAGHLGISWTYYMLSEKWQSLWPTASDPADYSEGVRKVAILMTDGEFNTYYESEPNSAEFGDQIDESNDAATALCEDMKDNKGGYDGITIYSIAFNAPDSAKATLQECATPDTTKDTYYYSAENEEELRQAFLEIAKSIKKLRLSQ